MARADWAYLVDLAVAADAELGRLRQAARVTLTAMVATALLHPIAGLFGQPTSVALVGINVAMMGVAVVNDATPRAQRISTGLVPLVAGAALVVGALVHAHAWLRDGVFLAVVFTAVLVRRFGPRGQALGMIGYLAYFFALYFQADLELLPLMLTSVTVATALAYAARFWVVRERAESRLRLRLAALRRTIAVALHRMAAIVAEGREAPRRMRALRRTLGAINESALAIDEQLDRVEPAAAEALRSRVFALELALEEVAAAVAPEVASGRAARAAVAAALTAARGAVRAGDGDAAERVVGALPGASSSAAEAEALAQVEAALRSLFAALKVGVAFVGAADRAAPTVPTRPPTWRWSLRLAAQATLAAGLALAAGHAVASTRAYWAMMAAFMVFSRANTRGAMLVRAWQRMLGTVVGVIVGLLVAHAVQGHVHLELAVLFACMFVAYYTLQVAYAWMVAAITTLIAVLYSLLGMFSPELLYLRVLETLVGVGVGAGVAMLVFPVSTRATIRAHMIDALRLLADALDRVYAEPGPDRAQRHATARALDRKLRDVRSEVQGAAGGVPLPPVRDAARLFLAFAGVFFHARPLVLSGPRGLTSPQLPRARATAERLARRARGLADALAGAPRRADVHEDMSERAGERAPRGGGPATDRSDVHEDMLEQAGSKDVPEDMPEGPDLRGLGRLAGALQAFEQAVEDTGIAAIAGVTASGAR